ncbi:MAG: fused MFS/spermidine synthase [Candidatus Coatesbacteria bacterium]|nr:MAG: fused MFS/spermidine synthase [Candidatus Coatesbacteria bacterium]
MIPDNNNNKYLYYRVVVYILFFASGAAGLVYEVIWMRMLSITLGSTAPAVAAVLASFMGGLALGSYFGGRAVDKWKEPLLWYAGCEAFIGLFAFAFPVILSLITRGYATVYGRLGTTELHAARFLFSSLALLPPTIAMGATLPAVVAALNSIKTETGHGFALAYGLNTAGAVAGVLLAGYWLLWATGARASLFAVAALNVAVGVAAFLLARRLPKYVPVAKPEDVIVPRPARPWAIITLAFIAGALGLAAQVLWVRSMSMIVGSAVYAFSALLAVILVAIAVASFVHRALPRRVASSETPLIILLALGSLGFSASIIALRFSPYLFLSAFAKFGAGFAVAQVMTVVTATLVLFLPSAAVGMVLPALVARWSGGSVGSRVGAVYAANTSGAIVGSLGGTFLLLPALGAVGGLRLLAIGAAAAGVIVLASRKRVIAWVVAAAALGVTAILVPGPSYKLLNLGVGISPRYYLTENGVVDLESAEGEETVFYEDGVDGTVAVIKYGPILTLKVNGKSVASTNYDDLRVERELGALPVTAHGAPRSVLVVGLGTGITLGSAISNPSVDGVVCVEINPAVARAAGHFAEYNGSPLADPRVELIREDGRTYALCTEERFDVITSDPIHPWTKGSSGLFSVEHFENCSRILNSGGVMAQWLPLYQLSIRDYFMIVNTFAAAFRHVGLVYTGRDTVLLGSERELAASITGSPYYVAGDEELLGAATWAGLNTDDRLSLEYSAPRALYSPEESKILTRLLELHGGEPGTERGVVADIMEAKLYYRVGDLGKAGRIARGAWEYTLENGWPNDDIAELNADIAFERGLELANARNTDGAIEAFEEVLTYTPDSAAAKANIESLEKQL